MIRKCLLIEVNKITLETLLFLGPSVIRHHPAPKAVGRYCRYADFYGKVGGNLTKYSPNVSKLLKYAK